MAHSFLWRGLLAILFAMNFCLPALSAQEDSAQLTFRKTAVSKKSVQYHTVRKDEAIYGIIRKMPGVTEKDIPHYLEIIKALNPRIKDWDKIYPGQKIALPSKSIAGAGEEARGDATEDLSSAASGYPTYRVKKGDYLIRIVRRKLNIPTKTQQAMLRIKELNPSIKDANLLYVGQILRLPQARMQAGTGPAPSVRPGMDEAVPAPPPLSEGRPAQTGDEQTAAAAMPEEQPAPAERTESAASLSPGARLEIIRHILTQMHGNLMTKGNYYLPISRTAQLTIDCSAIPVVELDDQTTVFLEMKNRSSASLKKLIGGAWSNLHIVKMDAKDDVIFLLKKIFQKSNMDKIDPALAKEWYVLINLDPVKAENSPGFKAYTGMSWYWDPAISIHRNNPGKGNSVYGWIIGAEFEFFMFGAGITAQRNFSRDLRMLTETADKWSVEGNLFFRI